MIRTLHRWALTERPRRFNWTFAAIATVLAVIVRLILDDRLPSGFPYLTFFPAVILTSFFAGLWPGTVAAFACGIVSWYFFIEPTYSFALNSTSALALAFYAFIVATDIVLIYVMARSLRQVGKERARSDKLAVSRDLMFRELQHRVSNNFAVVSSLIKMQRHKISDPVALQVLDAVAGRLTLIARIQRELHDPASQSVDVSRYLEGLIGDIVTASEASEGIATSVRAQRVVVDSEKAIPIALIVTELLSNSVEHAFKGRSRGVVRVALDAIGDGTAMLMVEDDGLGLPDDFDIEATDSLGLSIARQLALQIGATLTMENTDEGSRSSLMFPVEDPDRLAESNAARGPALSPGCLPA